MSDRDRLGPPPVEPMTNAAWGRVERGLFEQLDESMPRALPAPRARWPWLVVPAAAVVAAAVIALVLGLRSSTSETEIARITPPPEPAMEPSRVVAGDTPSMVSYGDAHLTVDAHAAIVMTREASSPAVLVERGAVDFTVAPRTEDPFVVRAGDVVVRVVGTQFRVARYEERIEVAVERGIVDVQFRGDVHRLTASQKWTSLAPGGVETTASNTVAPTSTEPEVDEPKESPTTALPAKPTPKPVAEDLDRAKYEQLVALERKSPEQAITGYLELSKGTSKWAAVGLYAAGRLAADRGDKRAHTFLTVYLKRFPRGANAKDARDLLSRLEGAKQ